MTQTQSQSFPPGRIKIVEAVRTLLENKEFNSITTAEIARTAGVTEGLIYKYFNDKRDLLYQVLKEYFECFHSQIEKDSQSIEGTFDKLRMIIRSNIDTYDRHRVFARILLLEARNSPDFFKSEAYALVKKYSRTILSVIRQGIRNGEIREDIKPSSVRDTVYGAIEHACLPGIIFNREIQTDVVTENICKIIFKGIKSERR
ncbi:MAG: TetR/AcrR family transcriptional regulator [Desulfobacteraceae bacterium]|nr:TetR/AcrR family transcriptional regulator [Desulfobacteraceae bacterium]